MRQAKSSSSCSEMEGTFANQRPEKARGWCWFCFATAAADSAAGLAEQKSLVRARLCLLAAIGFEKSIDLPRFVFRIGLESHDLGLLFIDGIYEHNADAFVVHALISPSLLVVARMVRRLPPSATRPKSRIPGFQSKIDRPKPAYQTEAGSNRRRSLYRRKTNRS